ncbi:MAG: hypothetical protein J6T15_02260 [Bacilli bacterium]|nr:hypothetical protein [Bacilli bacterium]
MKRGLILLSILSILSVASISAKAPQEVNAWQSNGETSDKDLEITFINEEVDDKGSYHYKYHIKNVGQKYIQEFTIRGPFDASNETATLFTSYEIKNDLFNYRTLLLAPNQETDVDFCVNEKFLDLNNVAINAYGIADDNPNYVASGRLNSSVLSGENCKINLDIDHKSSTYSYIAILKTTVEGKEYYFSAEESSDYEVYGNYSINKSRVYNVELIRIIKREKYTPDQLEEGKKERDKMARDIALLIFWPIILPIVIVVGGGILLSIIVAVTVIIKIKKRNNQAN